MLLSLLTLIFKMIQIWPVETPFKLASLSFDDCPQFLVYFLTFLSNGWPTNILYFLYSNPGANSLQQVLVPFSGCWYLETKIWAPRTFISTGLLFLHQRLKLQNTCMCTHRHTNMQTPQTTVFLYLSGYLFFEFIISNTQYFQFRSSGLGFSSASLLPYL